MLRKGRVNSVGIFVRALRLLRARTQTDLLPASVESPRDLPQFRDFLDELNGSLKPGGRRLLVALDEYETIDRKIGEGVFSEYSLAMLRTSIQTHRQLTWVFAGSHQIAPASQTVR